VRAFEAALFVFVSASGVHFLVETLVFLEESVVLISLEKETLASARVL
jgi:hypothetical protein